MESSAPDERPTAELIVLNGRLKGSRCPLSVPLTLVGQDESCDVRLNLDGIAPFHAALVAGPVGPVLRNLSGEGSLLINGHAVENRLLHDGDVLTVGPFQFQLCLPRGSGTMTAPPGEEALRIQAAAVASEQVRLSEQESRLEQRTLELETREKQLVGHLDEKRRRLDKLQHRLRDQRARWQEERDAEEQALKNRRADLDREATQLADLRISLQERHDQHWKAADETHQIRERQLTELAGTIHRDRSKLDRDRQAFETLRLRANTETEQARQDLREGRETLALAQQQWESVLNAEQQERQRRERQHLDREQAIETRRADVLAEERQATTNLERLRREAGGLDQRIGSLRTQLSTIEHELARKETVLRGRPIHQPLALLATPAPAVILPPAPAELRVLVSELADQRLHLAEQWERLLHREQAREGLVTEMEMTASNLAERERELLQSAAELETFRAELDDRALRIEERESRLEAADSRLRVRALEWTSERERVLADVATRERAATDQVSRLTVASDHLCVRLRRRLSRLAQVGKQLSAIHGEYAELWRGMQDARQTVVLIRQEVGREKVAIGRLRDEVLAQTPNTPAAERRLARLEKEIRSEWSREEADLKSEWKALDRERAVMDALGGRTLDRLLTSLGGVVAEAQRKQQREKRRLVVTRRRSEREAQMARVIAERDRADQRAEVLRDELERVALNLLGENPTLVPVVEKRAA